VEGENSITKWPTSCRGW